jgi:hypothetical protein
MGYKLSLLCPFYFAILPCQFAQMFLTALSYILEEYTLIYMVINYLIFSLIIYVSYFINIIFNKT